MLPALRETSRRGRHTALRLDFSGLKFNQSVKFLVKKFISLRLLTFDFSKVREMINRDDMTTAVCKPHSYKKSR